MFGFKYFLLSPHMVHNEYTTLFNSVYDAWKTSFTALLSQAGEELDPDDFFRNDLICAITYNDQIVGLSTMTLFDLNLQSSLDHHYIKALKPETIDKLRRDQLTRMVSVEYLNVLPAWRKSHSNVRWTEVLIGLSLKILDDSIADVLMGTPRTDVKVLDVSKNLNAIEVQEPIMKMNYPCAVTIVHKTTQREFNNPITAQFVNGLYKTHEVTGVQPLLKSYPNQFKKTA